MKEEKFKKIIIWIFFLIIVPIIISFFLYKPYLKYNINSCMTKDITVKEKVNKFYISAQCTSGILNFDLSEIGNSLLGSYIEKLTNIALNSSKYDLYFEENSYIDKPKVAILKYNISIEGVNYTFLYRQKGRIIEGINFMKNYDVKVMPHLTVIQDEDIETFEFTPSYGFVVRKSKEESFFKILLFILIYWGLFSGVYFVYEKLLKDMIISFKKKSTQQTQRIRLMFKKD